MEKVREAVKKIREKGYLVSPKTIDMLKEEENPLEIVKNIEEKEESSSKAIIEPEDIEEQIKKNKEETDEKPKTKIKGKLKQIPSKEHEKEIEILNKDISKESRSKGEVEDFVENFKSRYNKIYKILRSRGENSAVKIENAKKKNEKIKVIGLITEMKSTKNGHVFMKVEDPTG